ncbi:MAG: branched-chain-amino-acid transaminase [Phycisphaerales bacterium]|nr:branched-chain-amino-acid transaminase [Phycisphaerales bacterium]MBT7171051.1 branched-chain-amino-acid transaminase [Phycisphaerales bacterium]
MKIWMNDNLVDQADATVSVFDHGLLYGDGVFEGIRVYNGAIFQATAHLERLFLSAERIALTIGYTHDELIAAMDQAIAANGITTGYIRLVVTRGVGTLGLNPNHCPKSTTFIIADAIHLYTEEMYTNGINVITAKRLRTHPEMLPPRVKSLNYLNNILGKLEAIRGGGAEAIMSNSDGNVAEATCDNIFIVKDGAILTPPAEAGILLGITRQIALLIAQRLGYAAREENFTIDAVRNADEVFLTGTAAEIIAVVRLDDAPIGDGTVGPTTTALLSAFREFIDSDEEITYTE